MSVAEKIRKYIRPWLLLLFAAMVFYIWLAYQVPYTHDDWDWGLDSGIEHFLKADLNSRYAGNLIEVLITRSFILKTCLMGIVFALIVFLTTRNAYLFTGSCSKKSIDTKSAVCSFLLANALFLSIPFYIWGQTNGWVAGFSNFVISALGLMWFIYLIFEHKEEYSSRSGRIIYAVLYLVFGIVIQLFIENLTVFFLLFSFAASVYLLVKKKGKKALNIYMLFIGNTIGALIMFSSNIYGSLWNTGTAIDGYRVLQYDRSQPVTVFLDAACQRYMRDFIPEIISEHILLPVFISLILILIGIRRLKGKDSPAKKFLTVLMMVFDVLFFAYYVSVLLNKCPAFITDADNLYVLLDLGFTEIISVELVVMFWDEKKLLTKILTAWFTPFLVMLPMLVIDSIGGRCFYAGVICHIMLCQMLLICFIKDLKFAFKAVWLALLCCITIFFAVRMTVIYSNIGRVSRERYAVIDSIKNETDGIVIDMPSYPFAQYLWYPDPIDESRMEYYKEFYGIPDNVELEF